MISPSEVHLDSLPWVPLDATSGFPKRPAIYFAIDSQGCVQYVGRSVNVRGRWKNHHRYGDLEQIGGVKIAYLFVDTPELLPSIESALISWFNPPLNVAGRTLEGSKVQKSRQVRLADDAWLAGKAIARYFGMSSPREGIETAVRNYVARLAGSNQRFAKVWDAVKVKGVSGND